MKVPVAGGSGAIGRPLVKALVAARREAVGSATNATRVYSFTYAEDAAGNRWLTTAPRGPRHPRGALLR